MDIEEIENIKCRFIDLKNDLDEMHIASINSNVDAKIVLEHIIFDYHVKKEIIEIVKPEDEFYNLLDRWLNEVDKILKECYPLIYNSLKKDVNDK